MKTQAEYITLTAAEDITAYHLVELESTGVVLAGVDSTVYNAPFLGVAMIDASGGDPVQIALVGNKTHLVYATDAIAVADPVTRSANGTVAKATTGDIVVGLAITAGEDGSIVELILLPIGAFEL